MYHRLLISFLFIFLFLFTPVTLYAFGSYSESTNGYDISFPQCNNDYPSKPYTFGVIGINDGKTFTKNPCLLPEYLWAKSADRPVSFYINLNYPSGVTATFGIQGPQQCNIKDIACEAYNYGYNAAEYSYNITSSDFITASTWWIDIETMNTWSDTTSLNTKVLQGSIDFLSAKHITVGIYSTRRQWLIIMGNTFKPMQDFIHILPNWVVGDEDTNPAIYCFLPFLPGSQVWLVQDSHKIYDGDYACL